MKRLTAVLLVLAMALSLVGCGKKNTQRPKARAYMEQAQEINKTIEAELSQGYTLEEPLVLINPYGLSPLTALLGFTTQEDTTVSVLVKGKDQYTDIAHAFTESKKQHLIPVLGLYGGYDNTVVVTVKNAQGEQTSTTLTLTTEPLPEDISTTDVRVAKPEKMAPGVTFFECPVLNANYRLAIDCNGDVRWFFSDTSFGAGLLLAHLSNGNMTVSSGQKDALNPFIMNDFYEITPLGEFVREYRAHGVHHDVIEKKNGNLIICTSPKMSLYMFDRMQEIDRDTGKVLKTWDLRDIIPMEKYEMAEPYKSAFPGGETNWFHQNAVVYLEDEDAFLISGRHQDTVMKFDASTNEIRWIFSGTIGDLNEELRPYLLKPITEDGEEFEYPRAQHAAMQTPEGDLMLFDNANMNEVDENGQLIQENLYSRAVRYEIDEENMTIKQVWQYGKERGVELYSSYLSDVDYLADGHYLINFGGMIRMPDGSAINSEYAKDWQKDSEQHTALIEVKDDEVVFEAWLLGQKITNSYKAERMDIYQGVTEVQP